MYYAHLKLLVVLNIFSYHYPVAQSSFYLRIQTTQELIQECFERDAGLN